MSRTVFCPEEVIVVSKGKEDIGRLAALGNDGKFDPSVIPVIDDLQSQITEEVSARTEADKQLQANLDAEALARTNVDAKLQANIDAEAEVRAVADEDLQEKLAKEITARTDSDTTLQSNIDAEVVSRTEADAKLQANIDAGILPAGSIVMWSGSVNSIPTNWSLCNGSNGTPNLLDRMVVCAGNSYAVGANGGETTHKLTVAEMPTHNHSIGGQGSSGDGSSSIFYHDNGTDYITLTSSNAGGDASHNNMPPYYALAYIMRIA